MEVVIKIDDETYKEIKKSNTIKEHLNKVDWSIRNGTPLPKGHGRLIDADHFNTDCGIRAVDCPGKCEKCSDCVVKYEDICNAKTIVEADKG